MDTTTTALSMAGGDATVFTAPLRDAYNWMFGSPLLVVILTLVLALVPASMMFGPDVVKGRMKKADYGLAAVATSMTLGVCLVISLFCAVLLSATVSFRDGDQPAVTAHAAPVGSWWTRPIIHRAPAATYLDIDDVSSAVAASGNTHVTSYTNDPNSAHTVQDRAVRTDDTTNGGSTQFTVTTTNNDTQTVSTGCTVHVIDANADTARFTMLCTDSKTTDRTPVTTGN